MTSDGRPVLFYGMSFYPASQISELTIRITVKAMYEYYVPNMLGDMSFNQGDMIAVTDTSKSG